MVVVRLETRAPLRPLSLAGGPSSLLRKGGARKTVVRRNLFGASKDPESNLRIASAWMDSSAAAFASRWGFDPVAGVPLPFGRFSWTPLPHEGAKRTPIVSDEKELKTETPFPGAAPDSRNPGEAQASVLAPLIDNLNISPEKLAPCPQQDEASLTSVPDKRGVLTPGGHRPPPLILRGPTVTGGRPQERLPPKPETERHLRQAKITDYGRITKRKKTKEFRFLM